MASLSTASAQVADASQASDSAAQQSAEAGTMLPLTQTARTDSQKGYVRLLGGYDSAHRSLQSEARVEFSLLPWLALYGGPVYTQHPERFRPFVGARAQALSQARHGFDFGVGLMYRPEGFTEAEGEFELTTAFARRFGRLGTFANLVYGQDPEARERDGELRVAALYAVAASVQAGIDARLRADLGSDRDKLQAEGGARWDVVVGPTLSYATGPIATLVQAGLSVLADSSMHYGAVILLGIAGVR